MNTSLFDLIDLYRKFKSSALCLDIETTHYNGPIALIGVYKPKDGEIDYVSLIRGHNLSSLTLKNALRGCKLLITYNGLRHDVPKIRSEFPGSISENIHVVDVFLLAKYLNLGTSLYVLENTLNIKRPDNITRKGRAIHLWQKHINSNDKTALQKLLDYNRQDTINLYPIVEELIRQADQNIEINKIKNIV